ncbi:MAG TPA: hypothetical protein VJG90_03970 [Candidatus Nanoarchaeia archaeon]|nr:hypothetical protein [Candidatus Nanoarchaeia archaeon]
MLRVTFDTNIYGFLSKENDAIELKHRIRNDKGFIVYGFQPVRKELRDIPKDKEVARQSRIALLELYDWITEGHILSNSDRIVNFGKGYYKQYREVKGLRSWSEIGVDFLVVACATLNNLDVVCSGDQKTLLSERAQLVYNKVNRLWRYRTPNFLDYENLLEMFRKK